MGCQQSKFHISPALVWCDHEKCCSKDDEYERKCCDAAGCRTESHTWNDNTSGITLTCPTGYNDDGIEPHPDVPSFSDTLKCRIKDVTDPHWNEAQTYEQRMECCSGILPIGISDCSDYNGHNCPQCQVLFNDNCINNMDSNPCHEFCKNINFSSYDNVLGGAVDECDTHYTTYCNNPANIDDPKCADWCALSPNDNSAVCVSFAEDYCDVANIPNFSLDYDDESSIIMNNCGDMVTKGYITSQNFSDNVSDYCSVGDNLDNNLCMELCNNMVEFEGLPIEVDCNSLVDPYCSIHQDSESCICNLPQQTYTDIKNEAINQGIIPSNVEDLDCDNMYDCVDNIVFSDTGLTSLVASTTQPCCVECGNKCGVKGCGGDCNCATGKVCSNNTCVNCLENGDCSTGEVCNTTTNTCVNCLENGDCSTGEVCNTTTNTCVTGDCHVNGDCVDNTDKKKCNTNTNTCVECIKNGDCSFFLKCGDNTCVFNGLYLFFIVPLALAALYKLFKPKK